MKGKLLSKDEMHITLKKSIFWQEVLLTDAPDTANTILYQETCREVSRLGHKILFILKEYAEKNYPGVSSHEN